MQRRRMRILPRMDKGLSLGSTLTYFKIILNCIVEFFFRFIYGLALKIHGFLQPDNMPHVALVLLVKANRGAKPLVFHQKTYHLNNLLPFPGSKHFLPYNPNQTGIRRQPFYLFQMLLSQPLSSLMLLEHQIPFNNIT